MVLVLSEMIYMAMAIMALTLIFRKVFMYRMGLGPGSLPLVSAMLSVLVAMLAKKYGGYESSELVLYMSAPLASWSWDAFFKYFFKK